MLRRLIILLWLGLTALALSGTVVTIRHIASDPLLSPFRAAAMDEIMAATERMMAQAATADTVETRLRTRLGEDPRNWLALDALTDLAQERDIPVSPGLAAEVTRLREEDFSYLNQALSCGACALDPAVCSITQMMVCQAPVAMTPVGDLAGVVRAGMAYAAGEEIDQIDLALSVVGLGATVVVVITGGSSGVVKAGAGLAKAARKMGRLSPSLARIASRAFAEGVDWAGLPGVRSTDDLAALLRVDLLAPVTDVLADLGRIQGATDATTVLHLLPLVDDAADARRLANLTEALGPKVVGRAEILGKVRLFRATVRLAGVTWALVSAVLSLALCAAGLVASLVEAMIRGQLRRLAAR